MALTKCPSCGRNTTYTEKPQRYSKTEWLECDVCHSMIFRVGSSFGF